MQRGASLIETVIYIFIFTMLAVAMINALLSLSASYAAIRSSVALETAAETALEKISREARNSSSIDLAQSTFNSSPGVLVLNSTDEADSPLTLEFYLSDERVRLRENGVDIGPLSSSGTRITELVFYRIITSNSEAVRIRMTAESGDKSRTFYATAVLRGSYAP